MTSVFKTDFGNGVVIYADDYVETGKWVFDCGYSRLISRQPLPAPIDELKQAGKLTIGEMYTLSDSEKPQAIAAIHAITDIEHWYVNLRYLYSGLSESNRLNVHVFNFLGRHKERTWAFRVSQHLDYRNRSKFRITAEPYDLDTYMTYAHVLQAAARSCPVPQ